MHRNTILPEVVAAGMLLAGPVTLGQTEGTAVLNARILNYPATSGTKHWSVVWVTNGAGSFIKTLGIRGNRYNGNTTVFWSNHWRDHCSRWYTARNGSQALDPDGYTSATAQNYDPPNSPIAITWNCRDASDQLVPDGTYKFWIQYSEDDDSNDGPYTTTGLQWTKGTTGDTTNYPNQGSNFSNMSVVWTPVVPALPTLVVEQAGSPLAPGATSDYGSSVVGTAVPRTFTIRNTGTANLTGVAATVDGANSSDFAVTLVPAATVAPAATATVSVAFNPTAAGTRTAALRIASNDPTNNPFTVNLSGTGVRAFDDWAATAGLPAGQDGPQDSPQGDGVTNLLKFAFNMDPARPDAGRLTFGAADTAGLPAGAPQGGKLRIEYLRRKASTNPGITYTVQFSGDASTWSDFAGAPVAVTSIDATWERVVVEDAPPPAATTRFGRLKVVLAP